MPGFKAVELPHQTRFLAERFPDAVGFKGEVLSPPSRASGLQPGAVDPELCS